MRDATQTDGKAQVSLQRLKLFRRYYVMVLLYVYGALRDEEKIDRDLSCSNFLLLRPSVSRIMLYLLEISLYFRYQWLGPLFVEVTTLTFYVVVG